MIFLFSPKRNRVSKLIARNKWLTLLAVVSVVIGLLTFASSGVANDCHVLRQRVHASQRVTTYAGSSYASQSYGHLQQVLAVEYPVYYSVGAGLREEAIAERVLARLEERLRDRTRSEYGRLETAAGEKPAGQELTAAETIFANKCLACHGGERAEGGLRLTPDGLAELTTGQRWHAWGRAAEESMPPAGDKVTVEELEILTAWRDGAD